MKNHVERPFAHCCAEAGGDAARCDCINKNHGTAWFATPPASDAAVPAGEALLAREIAAQFYDKRDPIDPSYRDIAHNIRRGRYDDQDSVELVRFALAFAAAAPKLASDANQENDCGVVDAGKRDSAGVSGDDPVADGHGQHRSVTAPKVASDTGAITPEWCLRMADLEAGQEIGAGALDHPLRTKCELPPAGWICTRTPGHDGPCATVASDTGAAKWRPFVHQRDVPTDGTWFVARSTKPGYAATRVVRYARKTDRLPTDDTGAMWPSEPTEWMSLDEFAAAAPKVASDTAQEPES